MWWWYIRITNYYFVKTNKIKLSYLEHFDQIFKHTDDYSTRLESYTFTLILLMIKCTKTDFRHLFLNILAYYLISFSQKSVSINLLTSLNKIQLFSSISVGLWQADVATFCDWLQINYCNWHLQLHIMLTNT
jgi:hypothetical protein